MWNASCERTHFPDEPEKGPPAAFGPAEMAVPPPAGQNFFQSALSLIVNRLHGPILDALPIHQRRVIAMRRVFQLASLKIVKKIMSAALTPSRFHHYGLPGPLRAAVFVMVVGRRRLGGGRAFFRPVSQACFFAMPTLKSTTHHEALP